MSAPILMRLGDVVTEAKPGFACGEVAEDGIFQVRMNNVTRTGQLDLSKKRLVPRSRRGLDGFLLEEGDVLFNATNSPDLVGKTARFSDSAEPAVFSNHFLRLRADESRVINAYLVRWLQRQFDRGVFKAMCRQWVNQASIGREALLGLDIPVLAPSEQRRIVEVLDRADELRVKRRKALAQIDGLTQSIFLRMFGDPFVNHFGWPIVRVRDAGVVQLGRQRAPKYQSGKYLRPYLRVANVYEDRIDLADVLQMDFDNKDFEAYRLEYGDILLNEGQSTELVGRPAMWRGEIADCCFQNTLVRFQGARDLVDPQFALSVFIRFYRSGRFSSLSSKTSSIAHLGAARFAAMPFPLPPLSLQQDFAARAAVVEELKATYRASLVKLDELFASLQDRAFRGEL